MRIAGFRVISLLLIGSTLMLSAATGGRLPEAHDQLDCTSCHSLLASVTEMEPVEPDRDARCRDCHSIEVDSDNQSTAFHLPDRKDCTSCHSFHSPELVTVAGTRVTLGAGGERNQAICMACHRQGDKLENLSAAHRQAAEIFHSGASAEFGSACMSCHGESSAMLVSLGEVAAPLSQAPQFPEHGSHPVGVSVIPGSGVPGNRIRAILDERIELVDGKMECLTCHSLASNTSYRLAGFSDRNELCRACHQVGNPGSAATE